jgi:hypothetical protein
VSDFDGDSLVAEYDTKKELRACWEEDLEDFLEENNIDIDDCTPYVMAETASGRQHELTIREILGAAA